MLVKFWGNKKGGSESSIDYLLDERFEAGTARILKGNAELTRNLINTLTQKHKTCVGCLSFEESNIAEHLKQEIIEGFERALLTDEMQERYNILWVEHRDKGRLELNFVIPRIDLATKKAFTPYYHRADLARIDTWKNLVNLEHNFSNPEDLTRVQKIQHCNTKIPQQKKLFKDCQELDDFLHDKVKNNFLDTRQEIIELLEEHGIEVTRQGKDYISVKLPESKKAIRLKGEIYHEQFGNVAKHGSHTDQEKAGERTADTRASQSDHRHAHADSREQAESDRRYDHTDRRKEVANLRQKLHELITHKQRYYATTHREDRTRFEDDRYTEHHGAQNDSQSDRTKSYRTSAKSREEKQRIDSDHELHINNAFNASRVSTFYRATPHPRDQGEGVGNRGGEEVMWGRTLRTQNGAQQTDTQAQRPDSRVESQAWQETQSVRAVRGKDFDDDRDTERIRARIVRRSRELAERSGELARQDRELAERESGLLGAIRAHEESSRGARETITRAHSQIMQFRGSTSARDTKPYSDPIREFESDSERFKAQIRGIVAGGADRARENQSRDAILLQGLREADTARLQYASERAGETLQRFRGFVARATSAIRNESEKLRLTSLYQPQSRGRGRGR
ncbi:relaxase/mobilization nuclease domain-containing protein [Helicobacter suis]|uniref:relaxase/mobilization nuclease domain-containing protein n=1 Tax=Helicobacter suis TaxID=104628 RepID=UPI0013D7624C|nr:relaxase/mobilization nuclease domain-containing protein [Helicobacter suis]